ncbi:uncharacterized protein VDAG_04676 [Verticillium dahliae VdLs.17]|uniref:Uncharacterized protein n=1 Tax=Verticillium dahliae (strain VdLs.17 / ATCC MYA-4575 / FGSC 10137) TaxID=498257 RepID=G2X3T9_VERDV|nr:uncharacterized protein VDAG_04676 [Verticillium dahliae VdLs.17]EGY23238.1 hypothetical protein VDAG_04676 [Verticillium dahliae VdLs.17]KAH6689381.1 hypothetical protein EV126DRAFT_445638 [Verticillium dahliae]
MGKDDCSPDQVPGASSEKAAQTGPPDKAPPHRRLFLNQQRALATVQREYRIGNSIVIEGEIGVGTQDSRDPCRCLENFEGGFQALAGKAKASFGSAPPFLRHDPYQESGRRMRLATRRENLEQFEKWFEDERQMWCVIVDRADDEELLLRSEINASMNRLGMAEYLPRGRNVFHVFTTRKIVIFGDGFRGSIRSVRLQSPSMMDAITLLQDHGGIDRNVEMSKRLVTALKFNPLAIREIDDSRKCTLWTLLHTTMSLPINKKQAMDRIADPNRSAVLQALEETEA